MRSASSPAVAVDVREHAGRSCARPSSRSAPARASRRARRRRRRSARRGARRRATRARRPPPCDARCTSPRCRGRARRRTSSYSDSRSRWLSADVGSSITTSQASARQRLRDLHHLALADAERSDAGVGRHVELELGEDLARAPAHRPPSQQPGCRARAARGRGTRSPSTVRSGARLKCWWITLMPALVACSGRLRATWWPSIMSEPVVGRLGAGEHLHERRLAGAVLAHERDDLAGAHLERDVVDGDGTRETLADAVERDGAERRGRRPRRPPRRVAGGRLRRERPRARRARRARGPAGAAAPRRGSARR